MNNEPEPGSVLPKLWVEPRAHLIIHGANLETMARYAYSEMRHDLCIPYVPEAALRQANAEIERLKEFEWMYKGCSK